MLFTSTHIFYDIVGGRYYRKFPFKSLWEQGYQFPRKIDIRLHKLLGTLHFKQTYKLYFICNINLRIDILLYVCFLHIKNHIWEFWWTCCQAGGVSYTLKPAHVVTSIKRSPVWKEHISCPIIKQSIETFFYDITFLQNKTVTPSSWGGYVEVRGCQIILEISSLWTIVMGNVYGECRAFCRFKHLL
jgi:hypothetical protein